MRAVYTAFLILALALILSPTFASAPRRETQTAPKDPYDYLFKAYRVPAVLCIASDQCAEILIDSKNLSDAECRLRAWQVVSQYVIEHGYDHFREIKACVR